MYLQTVSPLDGNSELLAVEPLVESPDAAGLSWEKLTRSVSPLEPILCST